MSLRERLAELEHNQWSDYMSYFLGKLPQDEHGNRIITPAYYEHLLHLCTTAYQQLPENQKILDREEADLVMAVLELQGVLDAYEGEPLTPSDAVQQAFYAMVGGNSIEEPVPVAVVEGWLLLIQKKLHYGLVFELTPDQADALESLLGDGENAHWTSFEGMMTLAQTKDILTRELERVRTQSAAWAAQQAKITALGDSNG